MCGIDAYESRLEPLEEQGSGFCACCLFGDDANVINAMVMALSIGSTEMIIQGLHE